MNTRLSLLALALGLGLTGPAAAAPIGQTLAVQPEATQQPDGGVGRLLGIGDPVALLDLISTSPSGQAQILFDDESTLAVGPGSEVMIDEFVYSGDGEGSLSMTLTGGLARYIGGRISKEQDVTIETPNGTIGIRGGMVLLAVGSETWAAHQFGVLTCRQGGNVEVITQRGFACVIGPGGIEVVKVPADRYQSLLELMAGMPGDAAPDGTTSLVDLFCDSSFGENHKDCVAPPGSLAHTQAEDLTVPNEATDEAEIPDLTQDDLPEIDIDDDNDF